MNVTSEHPDQEKCDHLSTPEPQSDGGNVTASDDSETDGAMKQKMDKFGINCPFL